MDHINNMKYLEEQINLIMMPVINELQKEQPNPLLDLLAQIADYDNITLLLQSVFHPENSLTELNHTLNISGKILKKQCDDLEKNLFGVNQTVNWLSEYTTELTRIQEITHDTELADYIKHVIKYLSRARDNAIKGNDLLTAMKKIITDTQSKEEN